MKKDRNFAKMANMPEDGLANAQPSIVNGDGRGGEAKPAPSFGGELNIRIPKSLHIKLNNEAKEEGVSLQEYILYRLAGQQ